MSKKTATATRKAKAHLSLENLSQLYNGKSVVVRIGNEIELTLSADNLKGEVDSLMDTVSEYTDAIFEKVDITFKKIFGKK
jgi:hypothetical protein